MGSRMDRYNLGNNLVGTSRSKRNKTLYTSLDNNAKLTTITDVRNTNAVELDTAKKNSRTREGYHKIKDYGTFAESPKIKKELDDFNYLYKGKENKIYDINSVIEEAKKNRNTEDESDKLRKINNEKYSITKEEIEKYREERKNSTVPDREKMKDLINTITSKTLSGEIDQKTSVDLLSDLMATDKEDMVEKQKEEETDLDKTLENLREHVEDTLNPDMIKKINEEKDNYVPVEKDNAILKDMDESFYTRSMDLSDKDFEMDTEFVEKKKVPGVIKFFLTILLLALIGFLIYFVYQSFFQKV